MIIISSSIMYLVLALVQLCILQVGSSIAPHTPTTTGHISSQNHHHDDDTRKQRHPLFGIRGGSVSTTQEGTPVTAAAAATSTADSASSNIEHGHTIPNDADVIYITKRDGRREPLDPHKILQRLESLCDNLDLRYIDPQELTDKIVRGTYPNVTSTELDTLASETAASLSTQHPDYARLAARICATHTHKVTHASFAHTMRILFDDGKGYLNPQVADLVSRRGAEIDARIVHERDRELTYFGYKTLERAYLLKTDTGRPLERPQYMLMRVALGIHCCYPDHHHHHNETDTVVKMSAEDEDRNLRAAFETYDLMSRGMFTHASPTLFHAGTTHPQLSSCFLIQMSEDSINGIYDTLKRCAVISKSAGGIGLSVHNIRARGSFIKGTRGVSNGLVPMLRVFDVTSRYVDQGGGKRPGAFAIYLEPWHADIFDVLNLKKNHGKEEQRARDLFYGLWIPDLFMKRVEEDGTWSLMCPDQCRGLSQCYGADFETLYTQYEAEGKVVRTVRARELWSSILDAQIETGTPYLLYKDACNEKSNQKNLGTIQCSNLCTEIIQYTDEEEVAVCNLASICLPKFVVSSRGPYGSVNPTSTSGREAYFDHESLHETAKVLTRNLNKIIDVNQYPTEGARTSNYRHRPIGIGVSGLADAFIRLGLPFDSDEAKALNEAIFETIYHAALEASTELAEQDGPYETFQGSPASEGKLQFNLWGVEDKDTLSHRVAAAGLSTEQSGTPIHRYPARDVHGYDWATLRSRIMSHGLRNSLLVAPMPTASTSQILGVNECFEPFVSNLYLRRVKAGEFIMANPHLLQDLTDRGLWNQNVRNQLMRDGGSVAGIHGIPDRLKELYKTVWEMKMKDIIDMAADRGQFIDQSQSLNLFISDPTVDQLTTMHFYAWKKGLKTGMYYLRTRPAVNAKQYTVEKGDTSPGDSLLGNVPVQGGDVDCLSCQG